MVSHDEPDLLGIPVRKTVANPLAQDRMNLHRFPFVRQQAVRLQQYRIGNPHLSEIMESRGNHQSGAFAGAQATTQAEPKRKQLDAPAMSLRALVALPKRNPEAFELSCQT